MLGESKAQAAIDDLFEEEALVLGGLVAVHDVEDDFVWRFVRSLDVIRTKTLRRFSGREWAGGDSGEAEAGPIPPHPAIEEFLGKLRREQNERTR